MRLLVVFRRFYRTVAFALFVSSLYSSFTRYFKNIPIQSSSAETFPAYELPTILICEKNQFDWEAATAEGYLSFKSFYTGLVNGSAQAQEDEIEVSWGEIQVVRGMGRLTLIQKLFKSDGKLTFGANVTAKDRFMLPQGHCKGIKAISGYEDINPLVIEIQNGSFEVFITDPEKQLWFKADETSIKGGKIDFDFEDGTNKHKFYEVIISEYNAPPSDCREYNKAQKEYSGCVKEADKMNIMPVLGCLPGWMTPDPREQCKVPTKVNREKYEALEFYQNFDKVRAGMEYVSVSCTTPCRGVTSKSRFYREFISTRTNRLYIYFSKYIEVTKYISSFTEEDLLVDIGSNLGLFIGFSIVDLIDFVMFAVTKVKTFEK